MSFWLLKDKDGETKEERQSGGRTKWRRGKVVDGLRSFREIGKR